jgi:transposase InsO family protein
VTDPHSVDRSADRWATFRLAVVGPLLAIPPESGQLQAELAELAKKTYKDPITGEPVTLGLSTIERWYYKVLREKKDVVAALRRRVRKDAGTHPSLTDRVRALIHQQYRDHPRWSYRLHWDNLRARAAADSEVGTIPSYPTVRRYMRAVGLYRKRRRRLPDTAGGRLAAARCEQFETRSYETPTVNGLWHLDFHEGSRAVVQADGGWIKPICLGVLDDRSRLACHVQWYLQETTEVLVHGYSQALQKRGLPWATMSDRGAAMSGEEFTAGLKRLGIDHQKTLPYSPHQNGKQESFWGQIEGRLLPMLEGHPDLTLEFLNEATQAWVEFEYNRKVHSELGVTPLERFLEGPYVGRECPDSEQLRRAFRIEERRAQRRSDGTIVIFGRRFEIPSRYRHIDRVCVRYARWNLASVDLVDERTGAALARLYPQDKAANADGERRTMEPLPDGGDLPPWEEPSDGVAPLLKALIAQAAATGLPPAYVPFDAASRKADGAPADDASGEVKA